MQSINIPTSKAAAMSYLQLLVSTGYRNWTCGVMHFSKAEAFASKMNSLYGVEATQSQRETLKKKGKAAAKLVIFPHDKDKTKVMYWLLATPGSGLTHEREKLSDALKVPLTWRDQYHLTQIQRDRKQGGKITWTWQMQKEYFKDQLAMSKGAADSGEQALKDYFSRIGHMPMFSGIRDQVIDLNDYGRKTWNKKRKSAYPQVLPVKLPTMPRIEVFKDLTLQDLVKQMNNVENERLLKAADQANELLELI
ncbi:hypothetical protein [Methylotenera versatilis]|uniref:hypothetical protein n=1 Tax=Methylotenera versatilis TaxID=1055487 RepID=UPI00126A5FCD|nr:hypothetical protein [Methylotenera versatilis]